jgi:hypothetical protein
MISKRTKLSFFLAALLGLTAFAMIYFDRQNEMRGITSGTSLARLTPVFFLPLLMALLWSWQDGGIRSLSLKPTHLKTMALILIAFFAMTFLIPSCTVGHIGKFAFYLVVVPVVFLQSFATAVGWFGYAAAKVSENDKRFGHLAVGVLYGFWLSMIFLQMLGSHSPFTWLSAVVFGGNLVLGAAASYVRVRLRSVWPATGLVVLSLISLLALSKP